MIKNKKLAWATCNNISVEIPGYFVCMVTSMQLTMVKLVSLWPAQQNKTTSSFEGHKIKSEVKCLPNVCIVM